MRSFFNIKIKGSSIWKACALMALAVFLICCEFDIYNIKQPATANVGDVITINTRDSAQTNISPAPTVANFVAGILLPKGFQGAKNMTVSYTSTIGNGTMIPISPSIIEPSTASSTHLNFPSSFMAKFGIGNNLINDMEWVVFIGAQTVNIPNDHFVGNINFQLKVGADGNTTIFKTAFVICDNVDGLNFGGTPPAPDYGFNNGPRMVVNGNPNEVNDLCDPQLTSIIPAKSLQNDFITLTYNAGLDTLHVLKGSKLYLCVDTAYTSDGSKLTGFCSQSEKTILTQTSASSGLYNITIWPSSFLGLTGTQTVTKMAYHVIDASGNKIGIGGTLNPFVYKYGCN